MTQQGNDLHFPLILTGGIRINNAINKEDEYVRNNVEYVW